jgi:hypothetical protein
MKITGIILKYGTIPVALVYFISFWFYKLDTLPGLHGDEAWFGLKAELYNRSGVDRLLGMNGYTGILQSLASAVSFKYFDINVFSLRLPGVICNSITLLGVLIYLFWRHRLRTVLLFVLFLGQSGSFLLFPKVAWEVTSFNPMFLAILLLSTLEIIRFKRFQPVPVFFFLMANVVGTYNHIIFSGIALALLGGTALWISSHKNFEYLNLLALFAVNAVNIFALECMLRFYSHNILSSSDYWPFALVLIVLVVLAVTANTWLKWISPLLRVFYRIEVPHWIENVILALCILAFVFRHGLGLMHALANDAIIVNLFSFSISPPVSLLLITTGAIITGSFFVYLIQDVFGGKRSLYGTVVVVYLGVFSMMVNAPSVRYYILLGSVICCYMTYCIIKAGPYNRHTFTTIAAIALSSVLTNFTIWEVYADPNRKLKAVSFTIGNSSFETSAHFLPLRPLIDYMRQHKIGKLTNNTRFIKEPVLFYKSIEDWDDIPDRKLTLTYDYDHYNAGYTMSFQDTLTVSPAKDNSVRK